MADPKTIVARLRQTADVWFGPGKPLTPVAPAGTPVRSFEYPVTTNVNYQPRKDEPITYRQMRAMADNSYLVRIIIEKVKDRISAKSWHLKLVAKPGEPKTATLERSASDTRIKKLTAQLMFPDGEHSWSKWSRALIEDMLVIDAATIYPQRTKGGDIMRLMVVDGSTINRVIDGDGMTPQPPEPAYQQIIAGTIAGNLTAKDILYMPRNFRSNKLFGFSPVEQLVVLLNTQILRSIWHLNEYDEGNIPSAFGYLPKEWSSDDMIRFAKNFEATLNGNIADRQKVYWLPETSRPVQEMRGTDKFEKFDEWIARCFTWALGESAAAFVSQMNRATSEQQDDSREEAGEMPLMKWLQDEMNVLIQHPYFFNQPDIEFSWTDQASPDPLVQAQVDQIYVNTGIRSINEIRVRDGLAPVDDDAFNTPQRQGGVAQPEDDAGEDGKEDPVDKPDGATTKNLKKKLRASPSVRI